MKGWKGGERGLVGTKDNARGKKYVSGDENLIYFAFCVISQVQTSSTTKPYEIENGTKPNGMEYGSKHQEMEIFT